MNKALFLLAALVMAVSTIVTAPVSAGNKKLKFGHPLGSFEASPHSGGSSSSYSNSQHRKAAARKAAKRRAAARRAAARRAAAKKHAARKAAAKKHAARKAAARRAAARKAAAKRAAAKAPGTSRKSTRSAAKTDEADNENTKSAPVRASAIAGTNTLDFKDDKSSKSNDRDEEDVAAAETTKVKDRSGADELQDVADNECKRYIPSAGMTVSVPCPTGQ